MNNKTLGILGSAMLGLFLIGSVAAFQFEGIHMNEDLSEEEIAEMEQYRLDLQETIENNNFKSWQILMESKLTQENFDKLVERHNQNAERHQVMEQMQEAWENEDYETVAELREQIAENMPEGMKQSQGNRMGEGQRKALGMHDFDGEKPTKGQFWHRFAFWKK